MASSEIDISYERLFKEIQEVRSLIASDNNHITFEYIIYFLNQSIFGVKKCLDQWKRVQFNATSGDRSVEDADANFSAFCVRRLQSTELVKIQMLFNALIEIIGEVLTNDFYFGQNYTKIIDVLKKLINLSFILDEQPSQVIKKSKNFEATLCILLDPKFIESKQPVKVHISSRTDDSCGVFDENCGNWKIKPTQNAKYQNFVCNLKGIKLKEISRSPPQNGQSAKDEIFFLRFQSSVQIFGYTLDVQVTSLPVLVAHGNQSAHAWGTVIWNNASFTVDSNSFDLVEKMPWSTMELEIQRKFESQTGCRLTVANLHFLCTKVFRNNIPESGILARKVFSVEPLYGGPNGFTFAEWFCDVMKLTRECLSAAWNDGLITGFISKANAEAQLIKQPIGTFLLRFSDSSRGSISVACVKLNAIGLKYVDHFQPFFKMHFQIPQKPDELRPIGDLIKSLNSCIYLYPKLIPKDVAFEKYYTRGTVTRVNGYKLIEQSNTEVREDNGI